MVELNMAWTPYQDQAQYPDHIMIYIPPVIILYLYCCSRLVL